MDQVRFKFERTEQDAAQGFDLGHVTVEGELGSHTSAGKNPDQALMIYLMIPELVFGVEALASARQRGVTCSGPDSAFELSFTRERGVVVIAAGKRALARVPLAVLVQALTEGVTAFLADPTCQLAHIDPAFEDLSHALALLDRLRAG